MLVIRQSDIRHFDFTGFPESPLRTNSSNLLGETFAGSID